MITEVKRRRLWYTEGIMSGGKNKQPQSSGYTIIEVLIFLAVSGLMFLSAILFISGKQANAEYQQGMNDLNSQINTTINDVANGYYPSSQDFTCTVADEAAPPAFTHLPAGTQETGTNAGCTFLGKVMQFGVNGTNGVGYNIYSVAGRRYATGSTDSPPLDFSHAQPTAADNGGNVNLTVKKNLLWGLQLTGMYKVTYTTPTKASYAPIGAIGFFGDFGNVSGGVLQSGAQSVVVTDVPNSALDDTETATIAHIKLITTSYTSEMGVLLCLQDGKGHKGSITIGSQNGDQLQTDLKMGNVGAPC